jgi:hypothetical protein
MHMRGLAEAIAKALQVHGYTVTLDAPLEGRTGQVHTVPILAEGAQAMLVEVSAAEVLEPEEVALVVQRVEDTGADLAILCHLGPRSSDALAATSGRVVLWGQDRLIRVLGEAELAAAVAGKPNPLPLDPDADVQGVSLQESQAPGAASPQAESGLDADLLGALANAFAPPAEAPGAAAPIPEKVSDLLPFAFQEPAPPTIEPVLTLLPFPPLDGSPLPPPEIGPGTNPVPSPHWQLLQPAPAPAPTPSQRRLPVRVDLASAKRIVKDRLYSVSRQELILQPVHLYDYECDILGKGSLKLSTVDGRVQVNGSDRRALIVDPDKVNPAAADLGTPPGIETSERVLRVTPERAHAAAMEAIMELHTRSVDVQVPDPDSSFFYLEKRRVPPAEGQIRLKPLGVHHRPVWRLIGANGLVEVDAVDGSILHKELRDANPDALLLE